MLTCLVVMLIKVMSMRMTPVIVIIAMPPAVSFCSQGLPLILRDS